MKKETPLRLTHMPGGVTDGSPGLPRRTEKILEYPSQSTGDRHLNKGGIINNPGDELSGRGGVEKRDRQRMDMRKYLFAQVSDNTLAQGVKKRVGEVVKNAFQQKNHDQDKREDVEHPAVFVNKNLIQKRFDHISLGRGQA